MLIFADTDLILGNSSNKSNNLNSQFDNLSKDPVKSEEPNAQPTNECEFSNCCQTSLVPQVVCPPTPHIVNITILGEAGTGKSSLVQRLTTGAFTSTYLPNPVANTTLLRWGSKNSQPSYFRFLDTNDVIMDPTAALTMEDRAEALHACLSDYVIVVFDVTDHRSFEAVKDWVRLARDFLQREARLILVGNKTDLMKKRQVHRTAGPILAELHGMDYLETSALSESNIHKLFLHIGGLG